MCNHFQSYIILQKKLDLPRSNKCPDHSLNCIKLSSNFWIPVTVKIHVIFLHYCLFIIYSIEEWTWGFFTMINKEVAKLVVKTSSSCMTAFLQYAIISVLFNKLNARPRECSELLVATFPWFLSSLMPKIYCFCRNKYRIVYNPSRLQLTVVLNKW